MTKRLFALFALVATSAVLVCALCGVCSVAYAETAAESTDYKNQESYLFVKEFVTAFPDRSNKINLDNVTNERKAADWLKTKFDELLPDTSPAAVDVVNYFEESAFNVSCKLDNPDTNKQILFTAHFDSSAGQGVGDNAFGVATLYMLLKTFAQSAVTAPYDLVFVAFGGEERGLVGSTGYVEKMSAADRSNTVLVVNIDSIAFGDNLYLFCENKHTDLATYLTGKIDGIAEKPYNKGIVTNGYDPYGYGYYETAQDSDHTPFRMAGIPVAFIFSGNYDGLTYRESADPDRCVMNTSADNLTKFDALCAAQAVARCSALVDGFVAAFADRDFIAVCDNAASQLVNNDVAYSRLYPKIAALVLVALCMCFAVPYFRKLQKRAVLGNADVKNTRLFTQPDADDIFTFDKK